MSKGKLRINEDINVREVRLIGENSEQLGIVSKEEALAKARAAGLDLCEIAANAKPPVCKLMDFGKYKYEMQKKLKEARKKQKVIHVKEVKLSPKINEHDYLNKYNAVERFISEGDKVKVTMVFRGREGAHPEFGAKIINRLVEQIKTTAQIDRMPKQEGNQLSVILSPMP
ncbi:MAG: translation initiation factor IF-3 [Candidatus Hydrogenedentota bacterium]